MRTCKKQIARDSPARVRWISFNFCIKQYQYYYILITMLYRTITYLTTPGASATTAAGVVRTGISLTPVTWELYYTINNE